MSALRRRSGFTLLEVVVALCILALSLYVLVDTQAVSVMQTTESRKILVGSYLAQQKMTDALLRLEKEGFKDTDLEESGTFTTFAEDAGLDNSIDFGTSFDGYQWAYVVRRVNIQLGDVASAGDQLSSAGIGPPPGTSDGAGTDGSSGTSQGRDLSDMGVQPDMISDMLKPYIREVRVVVWWSEKEPDPDKACEDCVELVTHVANPSGTESLATGVPGGG